MEQSITFLSAFVASIFSGALVALFLAIYAQYKAYASFVATVVSSYESLARSLENYIGDKSPAAKELSDEIKYKIRVSEVKTILKRTDHALNSFFITDKNYHDLSRFYHYLTREISEMIANGEKAKPRAGHQAVIELDKLFEQIKNDNGIIARFFKIQNQGVLETAQVKVAQLTNECVKAKVEKLDIKK